MPSDTVTAHRLHRALEPLHAMIYFSHEAEEEYSAVGLRAGRMGYFASRSAAMGPVAAGVTAATFYNFNPSLVAHFIPRAWTLATPAEIIAARYRAVDRTLSRLLGSETDGEAVQEAADLARAATRELSPVGRALYAGHADLEWPDGAPHVQLWHALTLLREYRGDGHLCALLEADLSGSEALVSHVATGRGFTESAAKKSRGWSDDEWSATQDALRARGLLDADARPTPEGDALRASVEARTDHLDAAPWRNLDAAQTQRLAELGAHLSRIAVGAGAFPPGVFASPR